MKLPEAGEDWSWNITRPMIRCTNLKCCGADSAGHPKVHIELLLHGQVRRYGTIDVQFYGDGRAVTERAQTMLDSVTVEQLRSVGAIADLSDESTWHLPCYFCGHRPGYARQSEMTCCPSCRGDATGQPSITCPDCHMTSYNPQDIIEGYCGNCHAWTSPSELYKLRLSAGT